LRNMVLAKEPLGHNLLVYTKDIYQEEYAISELVHLKTKKLKKDLKMLLLWATPPITSQAI
jgi:hypothetical protein